MGNELFTNLEEVRLRILKEKVQKGIEELKLNKGQQWTPLRLERPLLDTLLRLIENESL